MPLALAALVLGRRLVPTSRNPERRPVDAAGAVLSIVGVGSLVYAIIEAPHLGWSAGETQVTFAVAAHVARFVRVARGHGAVTRCSTSGCSATAASAWPPRASG